MTLGNLGYTVRKNVWAYSAAGKIELSMVVRAILLAAATASSKSAGVNLCFPAPEMVVNLNIVQTIHY